MKDPLCILYKCPLSVAHDTAPRQAVTCTHDSSHAPAPRGTPDGKWHGAKALCKEKESSHESRHAIRESRNAFIAKKRVWLASSWYRTVLYYVKFASRLERERNGRGRADWPQTEVRAHAGSHAAARATRPSPLQRPGPQRQRAATGVIRATAYHLPSPSAPARPFRFWQCRLSVRCTLATPSRIGIANRTSALQTRTRSYTTRQSSLDTAHTARRVPQPIVCTAPRRSV